MVRGIESPKIYFITGNENKIVPCRIPIIKCLNTYLFMLYLKQVFVSTCNHNYIHVGERSVFRRFNGLKHR